MNSVNHQIRLAARPSGLPETSDGEITTEPVPAPGPGEFVVAISYLCIDPVIGRLIDAAYREPVAIGTEMAVGDGRDVGFFGAARAISCCQQPASAAAIRAHVLIEVLSDTIQPFPSFSGIYDTALMALCMQIMDIPSPARSLDARDGERAQMSRTARDCRS